MDKTYQVERITASGRGAVAVVCVQAADAAVIDQNFFAANGKSASTAAIGRILFGTWGGEDIVVVRTAVDEWEINCHGGEAAVQKICSDLGGLPVRMVESKVGLRDRITGLLLQSRSRRTAEFLLAQREGVLERFLQSICQSHAVDATQTLIADCLKWLAFAEHLTNPWNVTIAGRPNAGKSSLLNAVIGYDRAIVFDQPGTTRDRIEAEVLLAGWPMILSDTAGIRETTDDVESSGVAASYGSLQSCDLCLLVVDSISGWTGEDTEILRAIPQGKSVAILLNKTDIASDAAFRPEQAGRDVNVFRVSATNGLGVQDVLQWIPSELVPNAPALTQPLPLIAEVNSHLQSFCQNHNLDQLHAALREFV